MSDFLGRTAVLPAASGNAAAADGPVFAASTGEAAPLWAERLFLGFAFVVLQGAFVDMASTDETASASTDGGGAHMVAFALLLGGTAIFARRHWRGMAAIGGASLPYFILPAIIVASVLWTVEPMLTLKRSILTVGICVFDLYVAKAIGLDRLLRMLSTTILISALASTVAAIAVPSIGHEVLSGLVGDWRGVFPQKNILGHVMSVGVFIELAMMIRARRVLLGACLRTALLFFLVVMAHSASSLLAVVLALIMTAVYAASRRGLASAVVCAIVSIGSVVLVAGTVGGDVSTLFNLLDRDPSLTGRTELWEYVVEAIGERPVFGWGYMAFWTPDSRNATYIQNLIGWPAPNAHNGYLELTLSLGLVGLAGFVVTALWAVKRIVISIMQKNDLGALLLIMSTQLLVANLTESFMISASVFGWNVFSIFVLKASAAARPAAGLIGSPPTTLLDRAKIRA